jgi:hypothetical protein
MDKRFVAPLERAGYTVTQESKSRYLHGMMQVVAPHPNPVTFDFLRHDYMLRVFNSAAFRKGSAYTAKELQQIAQPADALLEFLRELVNLVQREVLQRGYRLPCGECGLEWWYPLRELENDYLRCVGCRKYIFLPLELHFAYRLNPLFALGINNGALTIFLALLALQPDNHHAYDFCAVVRKGTLITDIDVLLRHDGRLCLVECKDNLPEEIALCDQLEKLATIARDADADAYLATLADAIPEPILAFATENQITVLPRQQLLSHS